MDDTKQRAEIILKKLNLSEKKKQLLQIEAESMDGDFWNNNIEATKKMKELALIQKEIEEGEAIQMLLEMKEWEELEKHLAPLEQYLYLSGKYDKLNAILSVHAGQGGADAMDWAAMLYRMYARYCEKKGWKCEIIDESKGEEAGLKSVTVLIEGENAYGYLKGEQGTHRLVRLSPFNVDHLRHTSFALVEVLPQVDDDADISVKEDDLDWDFFRASGHGGQNVQKVSSAVRLKHIPTGIVVTCQTERYQAQNREYALKMLKAKLWALEEERKKNEEKEFKGEYKSPSWGNQIRSYVLHPYQLVKDVRTKVEVGDVEGVLDGNIDVFIDAELKEQKA